jgi:hypothetical protein
MLPPINNNISLVVFLTLSLLNIKVLYDVINWIIQTEEGYITYKLFNISKIASYDLKVSTYIKHLYLLIDTVESTNLRVT